ncbi:Rtf2 RING-finger-domain-containing protein [Chaetomidium leptoderma]|uniref:Rtf2 RING-finger-domain-containing protein n=1 Tax=Chaetomidium leptoderma TaxID=669021 RepID=A0AAN6VD77_9PEZI|nr:Rtf2 RING-finger-domain-containing protein [Chaetomidium leptoderma]
MGNDGGSIPKRSELVKSAARTPTVSELKATALENLSHAWAHDPLTLERLDKENVVSDWRGQLYNYESVLRGLMPGGEDDDDAAAPALVNGESPELTFASTGIKSLRDVVKLKFRRYAPPGAKGQEVWACPVSLKELGPATRAVYLIPCGHVFAETAIKQIQEDACPECSEKVQPRDVIPILPTEKTDLDGLTARISDLKARGLTHGLKKDKSNGKKKRKAEEANEDGAAKPEESKGSQQEMEKTAKVLSKPTVNSRVSGINNAMTASLTARVLAEQEERNKRRKLAAAAK